ncbi:MAG: PCRF domain-containing protein, partial [Calditrichaeota bacterium]|nr:PCRF domain-containing protein [Calditrichota bacterium]
MSCSGGHFDLDAKKTELAELEKQSNSSSLWNDPDNARKLTQRISRLSEPINKYNKVFQDLGDLAELEEMLEEESGTDYEELQAEAMRFNKELNDWEFLQMLSGPDDRRNCILTIHPGAGGTESADWAGMLMRMYLRYVERRGFQSEVIDLQPADQAGVKSVSIEVVGDFAFGRLKSEIGVHRLVRISP